MTIAANQIHMLCYTKVVHEESNKEYKVTNYCEVRLAEDIWTIGIIYRNEEDEHFVRELNDFCAKFSVFKGTPE